MTHDEFIDFLKEDCGYLWCCIKGDKYYAIAPFIFTHAIIKGNVCDTTGYSDRWCYHNYDDAHNALAEYLQSNDAEPKGWHRHLPTGRRIDANGNETVRY